MKLSRFSSFALTRLEMKKVLGGCGKTMNCYCKGKGTDFNGHFYDVGDLNWYMTHYCGEVGANCEGSVENKNQTWCC